MRRRGLFFVMALLGLGWLAGSAVYSETPPDGNKIDTALQKQIDAAIEKGLKWLEDPRAGNQAHPQVMGERARELVLLTLVQCGLPADNKTLKDLLDKVLASPLQATYNVALQAMALQALDSQKYQNRIAECAQWLVDSQCQNGQWTYAAAGLQAQITPSNNRAEEVTGAAPALMSIKRKQQNNAPGGDNSNTQYAILGLRACMDSGIALPKETITLAVQWWERNQNGDGGWTYSVCGKDSSPSMSSAGISSLAILKYYLKEDLKKDQRINRGLKWLGDHFGNFVESVSDGYSYYSFERAGILSETEQFGKYDWYREGAQRLLKAQARDGSWPGNYGVDVNTCFAILFLKKATRSLNAVVTPSRVMMKAVVTGNEAAPLLVNPRAASANPPVTTEGSPVKGATAGTENPAPAPVTPPGSVLVVRTDGVAVKGNSLMYHKGDFLLQTADGIVIIPLKEVDHIEHSDKPR